MLRAHAHIPRQKVPSVGHLAGDTQAEHISARDAHEMCCTLRLFASDPMRCAFHTCLGCQPGLVCFKKVGNVFAMTQFVYRFFITNVQGTFANRDGTQESHDDRDQEDDQEVEYVCI
jgi:hypothetical protein